MPLDEKGRLKSLNCSSGVQPIYVTEAAYRQFNTNLVRLACFAVKLDFCADGISAIDMRPLGYGGAIYQVPSH